MEFNVVSIRWGMGLVLMALFLAAGLANAVPATRESFKEALQQVLKANETVKDDKGVALTGAEIKSAEVREHVGIPGSTRGIGRVTYKAGEATRDFEVLLRYDEGRWIILAVLAIEAGPERDLITEAAYFATPATLEPVALAGEQGKPVKTTESGLKYVVLEEGKGEKPKKGQEITAEYTGWLMNGRKFDSSKDHEGEFSFPVGTGQVIPGWDEALLDMKVGERRKLIIPPELAYGEQGAGGVIPPNATLIFEVQLKGIK